MKKLAKIIDDKTKEVVVGLGTDTDYYLSIGFEEMEVEKGYNNLWYLNGYAPSEPSPTIEEQVKKLEEDYGMNRWQREGILSENSPYSSYTKQKAQMIEDLAKELRDE